MVLGLHGPTHQLAKEEGGILKEDSPSSWFGGRARVEL
jgi:hypothetical protein